MNAHGLSNDQVRRLETRVRDAHREECLAGTCSCVTNEEHERMLASGINMTKG